VVDKEIVINTGKTEILMLKKWSVFIENRKFL
jgi:hypothetical protein